MTDMIGGQVKVMFDTIPSVLQHVQAGSLKAIATTGASPRPSCRSIRPPSRRGWPISRSARGSACWPRPERRNDHRQAQCRDRQGPARPEGARCDEVAGRHPRPGTPAEASALIDSEMAKWSALIKATGLKAE